MTGLPPTTDLSVALEGRVVRLEPLRVEHVADLLAAASEGRDNYRFATVPADLAGMRAYVDSALQEQAADLAVPYAIRRRDAGRVVGTTRFLDLAFWPPTPDRAPSATPSAAEIGATWLAASAQRTAVNTEAKLLMLEHAFEVWGVWRVSLQTDACNARSRAAIERLGARFEGIRRAHKPAADGSVRDSAYYSIIRAEWPAARRALLERLG